MLQDLDDLEVAAAVNGENVVARAETRVEAAIAETHTQRVLQTCHRRGEAVGSGGEREV